MKIAFSKKGFTLLFLFQIIVSSTFAQGFIKKDIVSTASMGFPHLHKLSAILVSKSSVFQNTFRGDIEIGPIKGLNPIALKYEYAVAKGFGIGIGVSWWSVLINVFDHYYTGSGANLKPQTDTYGFKISSVSFGIRPNYHLPLKTKKHDLFIGCALGASKNKTTLNFSSTRSNGIFSGSFAEFSLPATLYIAPTLGYRVYLANNFGLNFELGYEKGALFQAGLVFRFRPLIYEPVK